jgi:hypothetical protein
MSDLPRWTIADLTARYALEPALRDVFVEGGFDVAILRRVFEKSNDSKRIVYNIDSVDINHQMLETHGFTEGQKQGVIVLAIELESLPDICAFRCLADRDLDHWFGELKQVTRLIWTEYCSIEIYFFSDDIIKDLIITVANSSIDDWEAFTKSFIFVLAELYSIRLALRELNSDVGWLSPERCMEMTGSTINFKFEDYIERLLNRGFGGIGSELNTSITLWRDRLNGDNRNFIHGHDFVNLLVWVIRQSKGLRQFADSEVLKRLLILKAGEINEFQTLLDQ